MRKLQPCFQAPNTAGFRLPMNPPRDSGGDGKTILQLDGRVRRRPAHIPSRRIVLVMSLGLALALPFRSGAQSSDDTKTKQVLYYIPHTHWEGAVFKTREGYLEMGLPNILKALRLLKTYPDYKFTLDQVAYIKPFLERYPEEEAAFRRFIAEGRLEIVGGMDVMPDDVKPGS